MTSRLTSHPAIVFSPTRAQAWREAATNEDYYKYLDGLIGEYAKRLYEDDKAPNKKFKDYEGRLIEDYTKWKDKELW